MRDDTTGTPTTIASTTASPYGLPPWGRYTAKPGKLYAHVFDWPKDGKLLLTGVREQPTSATLLADGKPLAIERGDSGVVVQLPRVAPSTIASVIEMQVKEVGGGSGGSGGLNLHQPPPSSTTSTNLP